MYITIIKEISKFTNVGRKLLTNTLKVWKLGEMSKNWSGNWVQSWSRMMSVPYILMTKVISRWWQWLRHLSLLGNTELQNIARKLSTNGFKIWKMHIPETWKIILFIYLLQHRKPLFCPTEFHLFAISKSSVLPQWTWEIWKKTICNFTLNQNSRTWSVIISSIWALITYLKKLRASDWLKTVAF